MSIKFDEKNGNLMEPFISNKLNFISNTGEIYNATEKESLIFLKDDNEDSLIHYKSFYKNILKDRVNPRKKKYCSSCKKEEIIVMIYIKTNLINTCPKCKNSWFESDK